MKVLIAGDGQMALRVAEALMLRHQVICLLPPDADRWQFESLNTETLQGDLTSPQALGSAGVNSTDVFVACTGIDEQNIVACMAARRYWFTKNPQF